MRQKHPKAISSRLVRIKAHMALVTFWTLRSLLGPLVFLMGHKQECENVTETLDRSHDKDTIPYVSFHTSTSSVGTWHN